MILHQWVDFNNPPNLTSEPFQIWVADLDQETEKKYFPYLSRDELARVDRLVIPAARKKQIISRGILRSLLAGYLNLQPEALRFETSRHGKPYLNCPEQTGLYFNVSHSENYLCVAIVKNQEIGLDIEKINPELDFVNIAKITFSAIELTALRKTQNPRLLFYKIWTTKEAILKATGMGFAYPSHHFSVVNSEGVSSITGINEEILRGRKCETFAFEPAHGFIGNLAIIN